jgi:hypothetical protein
MSINDAQSFWHDLVTNHSGGVIDLVVKVLDDRKGAFDWLAAYAGVCSTTVAQDVGTAAGCKPRGRKPRLWCYGRWKRGATSDSAQTSPS